MIMAASSNAPAAELEAIPVMLDSFCWSGFAAILTAV